MQYIIFDDGKSRNFFPITLTRSSGDLRVGILKLRQRIQSFLKQEKTCIIIPDFLEDIYRERHPDWQINSTQNTETIFINSRLQIDSSIMKKIDSLETGNILQSDDSVIAAKFNSDNEYLNSEKLQQKLQKLPNKIRCDANFWYYSWDFIAENCNMIKQDFQNFFYDKDNYFETESGVTVLNPYDIWIGENAALSPGVIIDASDGPVVIDEKAVIMHNSVIIGPAYIGKESVIKAGAKIYEGTSIGPVCKVGGEVEKSIFQAYSNKQYDGFLGHSYLGEWINLGADTNNSDLKNNYKNVQMYFYPQKKKIDSGTQFLGTIIGDHSKTGINSSINTGTVIGVGCNLFGRDLISDFVPSFSWGIGNDLTEYQLDKYLETADLVKKRRHLKISQAERKLYENIAQNKIR